MCMCVELQTYILIHCRVNCMSAYTYIHTQSYIYISYISICVYACTFSIQVWIYIIYTYVCVFVNIYICTYRICYTFIYTYIYINIAIQKHRSTLYTEGFQIERLWCCGRVARTTIQKRIHNRPSWMLNPRIPTQIISRRAKTRKPLDPQIGGFTAQKRPDEVSP